jgi:nitrite reductase/ring-hydroxylating ferredoxin subunit
MTDSTRREFCARTCGAISFAALGSLLPACGGSPTSPSSAPALPTLSPAVVNSTITLAIDSSSPLAAVGGAALVQTSAGNFLVGHTAQDAFTALTAVCTHEACTVSGFQNQTYVCPCHGSQYSLSGAVVQGPAPTALRQFATRFASNVLTITVG